MKKLIPTIGILIILVLSLTACGAVSSLKSAGDSANAFMDGLKANDSAGTWGMMTAGLQTDIGTQADWDTYVSGNAFGDYKFTSNNISNGTGTLDGEAKINSDPYTIQLVLEQVDNGWMVSGITFDLK